MNATQRGWTALGAGLGMMLLLLAGDVKQLKHFSDIDPAFVAGAMVHLGGVLVAFFGAKQMPNLDANVVSNSKRAELSKDVMSV